MRSTALLAAVSAVLLTLGCGDEVQPVSSGDPGDPVLVNVASGDQDGASAQIEGDVALHDDCLFVGTMPAIWPIGTKWKSSTRTVTLPDGTGVAIGDQVSGGGQYLSFAKLESGFGEPVAGRVRACAGNATEVVVFNNDGDISVGNPAS